LSYGRLCECHNYRLPRSFAQDILNW